MRQLLRVCGLLQLFTLRLLLRLLLLPGFFWPWNGTSTRRLGSGRSARLRIFRLLKALAGRFREAGLNALVMSLAFFQLLQLHVMLLRLVILRPCLVHL